MAMFQLNERAIRDSLIRELEKELNEASEPIIKDAVEKVERLVRDQVARICISMISQSFDVCRNGDIIQIQVRNEK